MKKLLVLLALAALLSTVTNAQTMKKSPDQRAAHMTKALSKKLNLSADQFSQINSIFLAQASQMDSLQNNSPQDIDGNKLARKSIAVNTKQQVLAVLNDQQKQQFMDWEKMKKEKHREKKAAAAPVPDSQMQN